MGGRPLTATGLKTFGPPTRVLLGDGEVRMDSTEEDNGYWKGCPGGRFSSRNGGPELVLTPDPPTGGVVGGRGSGGRVGVDFLEDLDNVTLSSSGWDIFPFLVVELVLVNPGIQHKPEDCIFRVGPYPAAATAAAAPCVCNQKKRVCLQKF